MKDYLSLEGLSHFLDYLMGLFVKINDMITNYEIDEICGFINLESYEMFIDNTTGLIYNLYVENGRLKMAQVTNTKFVDLSANEALLIDETTDIIYKLYVNNEKLSMESVDDAVAFVNELTFVDVFTGITYKLYVNNGNLNIQEVK